MAIEQGILIYTQRYTKCQQLLTRVELQISLHCHKKCIPQAYTTESRIIIDLTSTKLEENGGKCKMNGVLGKPLCCQSRKRRKVHSQNADHHHYKEKNE